MTQRSASSQPEKQTLVSVEHTSWESDPYIGSEAHQRELAAFDALTDDEIDYSDIPPLTDEQLANAVRGNPLSSREHGDPILLDTDVIAWFRQRYPEYQTAMNAALRAYMASHDEERDDLDHRKTA
jgi:uncharacterized protein (DUF4415 family)